MSMQPTVSEGAPRAATARDVDAWLARIGLQRGAKLGNWQLSSVEVLAGDKQCGVRIAFTDHRLSDRIIRIRLLASDPNRPAFARTASFDLSHDNVSEDLRATAAKLVRVVHAIVNARDHGGLSTPLPVSATAMPAETTGTEATRRTSASADGEAMALEAATVFPTPYHSYHLEKTFDLADDLRAAYRRDGHVLIRGALDRGLLLTARELIVAALERALKSDQAQQAVPADERQDAYSRSFTQITNLGLGDAAIRALTQSRRIAKMAADLMDVRGVRIFCEDWLIKEPGAGITPWHQDAAVMPFDTQATMTVWIPFQPVADGTGRLRFARGSHRFGVQPIETINDTSEDDFAAIIRAHGWPTDLNPAMLVGDVSFHDGSTIHGALPNDSDVPRIALALHCFADGARLKEPTTPAMRNMRDVFAPGLETGAPAVSDFWPLTYDAEQPAVGLSSGVPAASPALHIQATIVPGPSKPMDIWVHNGRLCLAPVAGAVEGAPAGGFLTSGLVDCHAHLSWPHTPALQHTARTRAFMNANRMAYAVGGVLALRDMGSASDHVAALGDAPGLPRVHAAGMLVVPHEGFPFTPTPPSSLLRTFLDRLEQGATWIKVFTDWSSDWRGQMHTGFSETNAVTYPLEVLREAVDAAHRLGGRVAAHCFTRAGAEVAIRAGVDSLEHGWGVDRAMADEMAARAIAWIPLVGIASTMWRDAVRDQDSEHVAWIERSMAMLAETLPYAHGQGVPILAGTDWFPEVTVTDEIRELCTLGLEPASAAAAAMWEARRWLGEPGIEEGAPADLVLYRADPREQLDTLDAPALILIGGKPVAAAETRAGEPHLLFPQRAAGGIFASGTPASNDPPNNT